MRKPTPTRCASLPRAVIGYEKSQRAPLVLACHPGFGWPLRESSVTNAQSHASRCTMPREWMNSKRSSSVIASCATVPIEKRRTTLAPAQVDGDDQFYERMSAFVGKVKMEVEAASLCGRAHSADDALHRWLRVARAHAAPTKALDGPSCACVWVGLCVSALLCSDGVHLTLRG